MRGGTDGSRIPWGARGDVVILVLLSLLLRASTFGLSEISWDETAFALVAREILQGHWPFTTVFDHKPIGLYLHFAGAFALFGDNPTATRILGWIVVTGTAIVVRSLLAGPVGLARLPALFVASTLLVALVGYEGQAVLSEHFANLYCALAALFLLRRRPLMTLAAGACAGMAFGTSYLALPVIAGLVAGDMMTRPIDRAALPGVVRTLALFVAGVLLATAALLAPLVLFSTPGDYFGPQLSFLSSYGDHPALAHRLMLFVSVVKLLFPLILTGVAAAHAIPSGPAGQDTETRGNLRRFGGMTAGAGLATLASGYVYDHYALLVLPPLWLWSGAILAGLQERALRQMFGAMLAGTSLLIGTPGLFVAGMGVEDLFAKATKRDFTYDSPRQVARIAGARLRPGQTIYAICTEPVAYQLLHVRPPTKYPFYLHAFTPQFASALEIDPKAELQAIFAQRPAVFIRGGFDACGFPPSSWQMINKAIEQNGYLPFARYRDVTFFEPPPLGSGAGSARAIDRSGGK